VTWTWLEDVMASSAGSQFVANEPLMGLPGEDSTLVSQATRDRRAFAVLYERYVAAVFGYCYRRLGSREAAEDATSLIFTRALAALPSHRGSSFRGWLFGIAHHVVADSFRGMRRTLPLDVASAVWDPAQSPEGAALAGEAHRALAAALAELPAQQRQVVELRLAGLTSAEIGEALGCSRGAVDVAQHRAILHLRRLLRAGSTVEEGCHGGR
jgi:RNA polymerase sigma-70 factor (ECF subfamily)